MHPTVKIALRVVRKAGDLALNGADQMKRLPKTEKSRVEFMQVLYRQLEHHLYTGLKASFPQHGFVIGEDGEAETKKANYWRFHILDDGQNFFRSIPHYSIGLVCFVEGRAQHCVLLNPHTQEEFSASKGEGAAVNQSRLRVSATAYLDKASLSTEKSTAQAWSSQLQYLSARCAQIRITGSPFLDLAYVAAGRMDAHWQSNPSLVAAFGGRLLVQEAGGLVSDFSGDRERPHAGSNNELQAGDSSNESRSSALLAATPLVHQFMVAALKQTK